ncbi:hypothetical protein ACA910_000444 [Epithemia clementina (nom. ined.)]
MSSHQHAQNDGANDNEMKVVTSQVVAASKTTTTSTTTTASTTTATTTTTAVWDAVAQVYVGGQVALTANADHALLQELMDENEGSLPIFGYGSLCWKPGGILADETVTSIPGCQALGYRRCWAQKSADHRGYPHFPGIVCTLLQQDEVHDLLSSFNNKDDGQPPPSANPPRTTTHCSTEGILYMVPPPLVDTCLAELDFREKGGYARDIIQVVVDHEKDDHQNRPRQRPRQRHALLYRGTPDNPALWPRVLRDLPYAAAVISVSIGPSGRNDEYLNKLHEFLVQQEQHDPQVGDDDDTMALYRMVQQYQTLQTPLFFLYGVGSNQHNQLNLGMKKNRNTAGAGGGGCTSPTTDNRSLMDDGGEVHEWTEILLCGVPPALPSQSSSNVPELSSSFSSSQQQQQQQEQDWPKQVLAGGGHSAVLTTQGNLYLFGWNDKGQCGAKNSTTKPLEDHAPAPLHAPLQELRVETCALGFHHTLLIEQETGHLWAMGDNSRGQVNGHFHVKNNNFDDDKAQEDEQHQQTSAMVQVPTKVPFLANQRVVDVACGLFHSAAITSEGEVVVFGCGRFGQALSSLPTTAMGSSSSSWSGRWKPHKGAKLQRVACGRRHTVVLDEHGCVYSFGDNKYGQVGRTINSNPSSNEPEYQQQQDAKPQRVHGPWEMDGYTVCDIQCGWSHTVILAHKTNQEDGLRDTAVYGWGRNDKGQLGIISGDDGDNKALLNCPTPVRLFADISTPIQQVACGSEFTLVVDRMDAIWGCGWNEHGNLAHSQPHEPREVVSTPRLVVADGARKVANPPTNPAHATIGLAAGGAHVLAMRVVVPPSS